MSNLKKHIKFSKYDEMGAYHWLQCQKNSKIYNPPLEARYKTVVNNTLPSRKVLDIGCGDGYLMSLLSVFNQEVFGIDYENTAVQIAETKLKNYDNCKIFRASCYDLPFSDNYFDFVVLSDVFEHLNSPEDCLQEICRVLKSDGTLLLTTPKWRPDRMWDPVHFKEYKSDELKNILKKYFTELDIRYFWPVKWSSMYSTRVGWKLIKILARFIYNPFLATGNREDDYGQILALCRIPSR